MAQSKFKVSFKLAQERIRYTTRSMWYTILLPKEELEFGTRLLLKCLKKSSDVE